MLRHQYHSHNQLENSSLNIIGQILLKSLSNTIGTFAFLNASEALCLAGLNPIKSGILGAAVSVFKKAFQNEPPI